MGRGWFGPRSKEYREGMRQRMLGREITWRDKLSKGHLNTGLHPNQARKMSAVEAAYVGAMLDGEGTVHIKRRNAAFSVANSEIEFISAILRATGCGKVYYREPQKGNLPMWSWYSGSRLTLEDLAVQLAPYSIKAQKYIIWRFTHGL